MAIIEMRGIRRSYVLGAQKSKGRKGGKKKAGEPVIVHALRGVDFKAEKGEFVFIMGPSGSGKSTLMNIIGCLDKPTAGDYTLDGIKVSQAAADTFALIRNEKIGFVFQQFNLLARTSAVENVELPLFYSRKQKTAGKGAGRERALKMLEEVGMQSRIHHIPSQLSGGQQQRVAIARAMVNDPAFILADEPTGALDSEMTLEIMTIFQKLNDEGKTIIMVTHEPELSPYAQRIVTLRDGEIVSDVPVKERKRASDDLAAWHERHSVLSDKKPVAGHKTSRFVGPQPAEIPGEALE